MLKWTDGAWASGPDETSSGDETWSAKGAHIHYSSGNVGIGIADPPNALHLLADGPFPMKVESSTGPDSGIEFVNQSGRQGYVGKAPSNYKGDLKKKRK